MTTVNVPEKTFFSLPPTFDLANIKRRGQNNDRNFSNSWHESIFTCFNSPSQSLYKSKACRF